MNNVQPETTDTILHVDEHHFKHNETEDYKIFRVKIPFQTKKITFETIKGSYMEIPECMYNRSYAIIVNDKGNLKMKLPHSVISYHKNIVDELENDIINIFAKKIS